MTENLINLVRTAILLIILTFFTTKYLVFGMTEGNTATQKAEKSGSPSEPKPVFNPLREKPYTKRMIRV